MRGTVISGSPQNSYSSGTQECGGWPYENAAEWVKLPATLPDGKAWPKISIVTPSYQQGKYLEQTILSVANQGYPNVEHLVIDGGSTDETAEILERHRHRLAYVVSEPDRGQSHAINKGMARASGEIVTWLNSDDMLAPGALAGVALAFAGTEADLVAGICQIYREGKLMDQHLTSCGDGPLPLNDLLDLDGGWNAGQFFYQPEVMFKRELWERAGGYVDQQLYYSMDYELWVRFAELGARVHVIGRPVAWFRMHDQQKTHVQANFMAELAEWRERYLARTGRTYQSRAETGRGRSRLRVLLLNDHGYQYGAGGAHQRMGEMLLLAGHEVLPVALVDRPVPAHVEPVYTHQQVMELIENYKPDLAIIGNLHSAKADPWLIGMVAECCPALFVLHDFWLITGRCGYPLGCENYLTGCNENCPTPHEYPPLEPAEIAGAWRAKRQLLEIPGLALLANSKWTAEVGRRAVGAGSQAPRVETFRLSFPMERYRPLDRTKCRKTLGLPEGRFIVLITSEFNDPRKGSRYVLQALRELALPDALVVSTSWSEPDPEQVGSLELTRLGYITDPERLAMVYAAADLVVGASLEETFGQIFIEAIACGTPAVGFPVAGVLEAISDGVTGRLAKGVGVSELAEAILELYGNPKLRRDMGRWGRLYVENQWSPQAAYWQFFQTLARLGLVQQLKVPYKISFPPSPPPLPAPQLLSQVRVSRLTVFQLGRIGLAQILSARRGRRLQEARKVAGQGVRYIVNQVRRFVRYH